MSNDPSKATTQTNVQANQIAHQLIKNGKITGSHKIGKEKIQREPDRETREISKPFNLEELNKAIGTCKSGKAAGLDDIKVEQIKNFGTKTKNGYMNN